MNYYDLLIRRSRQSVVEAGVITVSDQVVTGTKGEQVSHQLLATASNGEELEFLPYVGNDCPANLSCSSSGLITGIPAEAKTTKVQFYVRADGCPYKLFFVDFIISEPPPVIPTDYVRRYLLESNLKDSKNLDNSDYDLTKPSGTTVSYVKIIGHKCANISNGCVYNRWGAGMGITNGGALSIWTSVEGAPPPSGDFKCFANVGGLKPFAVGYRNGHYAFAYTPSGGNTIISESSVLVSTSFWQLLTLNYDATNKKVQLWIGDKLEIEANLTTTLTKGSDIVVNGQNATNNTPDGMPNVNCRYRSLTFFNRTLTLQEIKGLYVEYNQ